MKDKYDKDAKILSKVINEKVEKIKLRFEFQ
jgi:hypothetical protein